MVVNSTISELQKWQTPIFGVAFNFLITGGKKEQRAKEKEGKRKKWFKKNNLVMFIPITPGNEEKHPRQTDWRHPENKTCGVHWTKDLTDVGAESEDWR